MIRNKSKPNSGKDELKQSGVRMRRSLSQLKKEQDETVFLQIQSKINPTPSFDVIRTISVQDTETKIKSPKTHGTRGKSTLESNHRECTANSNPTPDAIQDIFKDYHHKFHNHGHHNRNILPLRQLPISSEDSDGYSCNSDSYQTSQSSFEDAQDYSMNRDVGSIEEYGDGYTVDSSMSSITVPVPVRTDSITANELFTYFSMCAVDLATKMSNICVSDERDNHLLSSEDIISTVHEISVQRKLKKK